MRERYYYSKRTGKITLLKSQYRTDRMGCEIGTTTKDGYVDLMIDGKHFLAHRFAWFLVTGRWPKELDHKNGKRSDNRWRNLREATRSKNRANSCVGRNNKLGIKGVRLQAKGKYEARLMQKSLGYFPTAHAASAAYAKAAKKYFGRFARAM